MFFSEYKYPVEFLTDELEKSKSALMLNKGFSDWLGFGLGVVYRRLQKDRLRYADYGPYWWAVKELLRDAGYEMGTQSDPIIMREYRHQQGALTLMAATVFRDNFLRTQFVGSRQHMLSKDSPEWYVLYDADMEMLSA